jgi:hypothetical protein
MFRKKHKQTDPSTKSKADYWTPLVVLLIVAAIAYWALEIRKPSSYAVCLMGFNYTTRGISEYRLNGQMGRNIAPKESEEPFGGGAGCVSGATVGGDTVTVKWNYARKTREAIERGDPPETHEVTMPMPEAESNHSRYFQVHIFPDNHVELKLSDHS